MARPVVHHPIQRHVLLPLSLQACSATSRTPRCDASSNARPTARCPTTEPSAPTTTGPATPRTTTTGHCACPATVRASDRNARRRRRSGATPSTISRAVLDRSISNDRPRADLGRQTRTDHRHRGPQGLGPPSGAKGGPTADAAGSPSPLPGASSADGEPLTATTIASAMGPSVPPANMGVGRPGIAEPPHPWSLPADSRPRPATVRRSRERPVPDLTVARPHVPAPRAPSTYVFSLNPQPPNAIRLKVTFL
jgi:hypothetical protein